MSADADDIRLGDVIAAGDHGDVVLVGFPYDEGVQRNHGRVGARLGPESFRRLLQRTGSVVNAEHDDLDLREHLSISDGGDIQADLTLEEAHRRLEERSSALIRQGKVPFVVGGGNDQSYPNALGLLKNLPGERSMCVINIDAHLDVRPLKEGNKAHSGSPFRQLIEDRRFEGNARSLSSSSFSQPVDPSMCLDRLIEFACQASQCSIAHVNYIRSKSPLASIVWLRDIRGDPVGSFRSLLRRAESDDQEIFVSFDIDSIVSSSCPGVSAPATVGLTSEQACDMCFAAGQSLHVKLMDLSEFNPIIEEYRTGKLVTLLFYNFLLGRADALRQSSR